MDVLHLSYFMTNKLLKNVKLRYLQINDVEAQVKNSIFRLVNSHIGGYKLNITLYSEVK